MQVESGDDLSLVQELLQAHQYWQLKRLTVDLVILQEALTNVVKHAQATRVSLIIER